LFYATFVGLKIIEISDSIDPLISEHVDQVISTCWPFDKC